MPDAWCGGHLLEIIMSKKTIAANEFHSLKDMGYQQAGASDTLEAMARYALSKIVDFPQSIDDESKAQLYAGYKLRFAENNPAVQYAVINGQYIPATADNKAMEKITLTVDYAFSYTQQQFGQLKSQNNALYDVIKPIRDKVNTYCSNRLGDLKRKANQLTAKPRERKPTADFNVALKDIMDNLSTRCRNAKSRGDATADEAKLVQAKAAFWAAWNK